MTQYTTQMDAARRGIITPQMKIVAEKEHFDVEELRELIAKGQVIIPCNKNHKSYQSKWCRCKTDYQNQCKFRCFQRLERR